MRWHFGTPFGTVYYMLDCPCHRVAWLSQRTVSFALLGILSCAAGVASEAEKHSLVAEHCLTAETFLNQKLPVWQKRLKLQDWNITIKLVRVPDLKPKTLGNIHWDSDTRKAGINVLSPEDYKMPFPDALKDMEFTVVHELLHLQLSSLPRNEASRSAEEKAVNNLTDALLTLERQTQNQPSTALSPSTTETSARSGR